MGGGADRAPGLYGLILCPITQYFHLNLLVGDCHTAGKNVRRFATTRVKYVSAKREPFGGFRGADGFCEICFIPHPGNLTIKPIMQQPLMSF